MKICTIVGARPQFIKMACVSRELKSSCFQEIIVHTGQHYDNEMSKIFFEELRIPEPDYNLQVGSSTQAKQTAHMLNKIEKVLLQERPDLVLLYGDTNSTLAGAIAASKINIPVAHIEAGLRSFNREMPEEINRILTDNCSEILFAPTVQAVKNLEREGIVKNVYNVGDVMYESILSITKIPSFDSDILSKWNLEPKQFIYMTIHRPSNTDNYNNIKSIIEATSSIGCKIIFPIHPRTEKKLKSYDIFSLVDSNHNFILTKPLNYHHSIFLIKNSKCVITDSGGMQKEAYILGTPCITLREDTEWVETVNDGWNVLVGADKDKILSYACNFNPNEPRKNHYGDGSSSRKIVDIISQYKF